MTIQKDYTVDGFNEKYHKLSTVGFTLGLVLNKLLSKEHLIGGT